LDAEKPTTENLETQPSPAEAAAAEPEPVTPPEGAAGMDEACKREVSVEIPADVVTKQQAVLVEQYAKQARLPGFRKGKVPASVVRNRFAGEIQNEVMESLVPQYFREAVIQAGFRPVSQPYIYALEAEPGQAIRFKAAFEVLPEFELGSYQDIKVEKPNIKIAEKEVEAELARLQERQASFDPVDEDRGANDGEFAQVAFTATPKEATAEKPAEDAAQPAGSPDRADFARAGVQAAATQPVQMDEVLVEIGGANTIPEFSQNLRGAKPGGEYTFDVTYPQDFHDQRLAGKVFSYSVKVNAVKKKTLPELNDDFAKELSQEFQTLDQLKGRIRESMEQQQQHAAEHEAKEKLIEQLLEKQEFSVPRAMVERQIDLRLERGLRALAAQGMRTEDMRRMDFRRLRAGQREAAVKEVKSGLLLEKIARAENIQVSDEDLEQEISALAQQTGQTPEQVRQKLKEEGALERIRGRMRSEKALNFLYSRAG
jgi:trigger factor